MDSWPHWAREQAGQSDHGMTTMRVLLLFAVVALIGLLLLGPSAESEQTATTSTRPPCAELRALQARGITHGVDYWAARGACPSRHKTRP